MTDSSLDLTLPAPAASACPRCTPRSQHHQTHCRLQQSIDLHAGTCFLISLIAGLLPGLRDRCSHHLVSSHSTEGCWAGPSETGPLTCCGSPRRAGRGPHWPARRAGKAVSPASWHMPAGQAWPEDPYSARNQSQTSSGLQQLWSAWGPGKAVTQQLCCTGQQVSKQHQ